MTKENREKYKQRVDIVQIKNFANVLFLKLLEVSKDPY